MSFTNLNKNVDGLIAPEMDTNIAVRRILAILNAFGGLVNGAAVINIDDGAAFTVFESINNAIVTTAGQRIQLPNYGCKAVQLSAPKGNAGSIYAGGIGVTNSAAVTKQTGVEISQLGMTSVLFRVSNLNQIYIDADSSGDSIGIIIFR